MLRQVLRAVDGEPLCWLCPCFQGNSVFLTETTGGVQEVSGLCLTQTPQVFPIKCAGGPT